MNHGVHVCMFGCALDAPGAVMHTAEVRNKAMAYDDRRACMQMLKHGGRYLEYLCLPGHKEPV